MYHVFEGRGKAPKTKREKGKLPETKRKRENGNQQTLRSNSFREALPFHIDLTLHFQLKPWLYTIFTNSNG